MVDKNWKHTGRNPLDMFIGERLRKRRKALGHSKESLAAILNTSADTIERYETGLERLSSKRLPILAEVLGVSITYFFEGSEHVLTDQEREILPFMMLPDGESIIAAFEKIDDPKIRRKALELMKLLRKGVLLH